MALSTGARLGPYQIIGPIGAGGMGEVYRARDTRLGREVAVKVLPDSFAADPDRRARFEREAQAIAALSHPNVLAIHDVGTADAHPYVVTELLEGQTLGERLSSDPLPVRKAVEIAIQVARGLAAAHEKGLVHRDLKPGNIFLLPDGQVKILDLGLARPMASPSASGATATAARLTDPGTVMGTVGYMAPEQVRGLEVDGRTDLFALGVVLYEMVAGRRAFDGRTAADAMTAVLTTDPPDLGETRPDLPAGLARIVAHCLEKNPTERFQTARDVAFALEALTGTRASSGEVSAPAPRVSRPRVGVGVLVAAAIGAAFVLGRQLQETPVEPVRFSGRSFERQTIFNARFAPDGETAYFSASRSGPVPQLYVSRTSNVAPQAIGPPGTHLLSVASTGELAVLTGATYIGQRLFAGTLARMMPDGEPRPWLTDVREADWSPDGTALAIVHVAGDQDRLEYPVGTTLHTVTGYISDPRVSPDGTRVAFIEHLIRYDDRGWIKVVDRSGTVRTLTEELRGLQGLIWTPDGTRLVSSLSSGSTLGYQPLTVSTSRGDAPVPVLAGMASTYVLDISAGGTWLVTANDTRAMMRARLPGWNEERDVSYLNFSILPSLVADGTAILFTDESEVAGPDYAVAYRRGDANLPVHLGKGTAIGISPDKAWALGLVPSDMQLVLYPTGPGNPVPLPRGPIEGYDRPSRASFFPDGRSVLFCGQEKARPSRCYRQPVSVGEPEPVTAERTSRAILAPDGRTLLVGRADGGPEVLAIGGGPGVQAQGLTASDEWLKWAADGQSVFVVDRIGASARVDRVNVYTGRRVPVLEVAPPDRVGLVLIQSVDLTPDGSAYAYDYWTEISTLYTVQGVR